ncbi:hypothetical protein HDU93_006160 [Gonapodya sp. JEL0774]|nr:hypothetical protein HDU93_006160 [Gonapodya sp. JEL0774]
MTPDFLNAIADTVQQAGAGYPDVEGVKGLVVRSSQRVFSAGLNIGGVVDPSDESLRQLSLALRRFVLTFLTTPLPTVAEVSGSAIAGGAVLAMICDQRVVLDNPKLVIGLSETAVGLPPPRFVTALAEDILGKRVAYRHLLLGSLLSPRDALEAGYVDEVVSDAASLSTVALARLGELARLPAHSRYSAKLQLRRNAIWALGEDEEAFVAEMTELVKDPRSQEALGKVWGEMQKKKSQNGYERAPIPQLFLDSQRWIVQYRFVGGATDKPLMEWLGHYTFPTEAKLKDLSFAQEVYGKLVRRLLRNGTTAALYFATIDLEPTKLLATICGEYGQRACIGKVCADQHSPSYYIETTADSLSSTEAFIQFVHAKWPKASPDGHPLIYPVVTPRFTPTCSHHLLAGLGRLATQYDVHVQSHISESLDQIAFTRSLYPETEAPHFGSDAAIFDSHGLLTKKSVWAHGVHLTKRDLELMAGRGAAVSCCPLSNVYFAHGNLDIRKCWDEGVDVGLGTDISGGPLTTVVQAMRWAVGNSRQLEVSEMLVNGGKQEPGTKESPVISWKDAFYLATLGGAQALSLDDHIGSLEAGKEFDALLVDVKPEWETSWDVFEEEMVDGPPTVEQIEMWVEKFINLGDDRNLAEVYVKGRRVAGYGLRGPDS